MDSMSLIRIAEPGRTSHLRKQSRPLSSSGEGKGTRERERGKREAGAHRRFQMQKALRSLTSILVHFVQCRRSSLPRGSVVTVKSVMTITNEDEKLREMKESVIIIVSKSLMICLIASIDAAAI